MRTARSVALAFLWSVVTLNGVSFGQCGAPAPTRDPQGLAILNQMDAATGWTVTNLPADAVATGTVTPVGKDNTLNVTLKIKGQGLLRTDIQETSSTIVNNGQGAVITRNSMRFLPDMSALGIRPFTMPAFSDVGVAATDGSVSVAYLGKDIVNGQGTQKIQVTRPVDPCSPLAQTLSIILPITVWVDASSGLLVQIQYAQTAADNQNASSSRIRQFSNYKIVNGIAVAFTQVEIANGQTSATWQLNDVSFNVGLTDGDFALPKEQ